MTQVASLVRDALGHLGVLDANGAVAAIDMRDSIRALNLLMRRFEADGLPMGWSDVEEGADTLPLPAEAEEAVGYHLAIRLAPRYRVALTPEIFAMALLGMTSLQRDVYNASPIQLAKDTPCSGGRWNIYTDSVGWTR